MANDNLFAMNMVNPKTYYFSFAKFIPILLLISVASMAAALLWMLSYSDTTAIGQADIYWVFYLHIAAAGVALLCYGVVCLASLMQLANPQALMPIVFAHGFAPSGFFGFRSFVWPSHVGGVLDLGLSIDGPFDFACVFYGLYFPVSLQG